MLSTTTIVAWIGALTGVGGFVWDFYKWRQSRPRLSVFAETSEPILINTGKKTVDGMIILEDVPWNYITVTIINRGGRATTIRSVSFVSYNSWWARLQQHPSFLNAFGAKNKEVPLPHKLDVGEQWRGEIKHDDIAASLRDINKLWCHVYHSSARWPVDVKVKPPPRHLQPHP